MSLKCASIVFRGAVGGGEGARWGGGERRMRVWMGREGGEGRGRGGGRGSRAPIQDRSRSLDKAISI